MVGPRSSQAASLLKIASLWLKRKELWFGFSSDTLRSLILAFTANSIEDTNTYGPTLPNQGTTLIYQYYQMENINLSIGVHTAGVSILKPDYHPRYTFLCHGRCLRDQVEVLLALVT